MSYTFHWANIPEELKALPQWVIAGEDKIPYYLKDGKLVKADSVNPATWMDFLTCAKYAHANQLYIGYVLSKDDDYSCIDLDVKDASNERNPSKWTSQEQYDRFWAIAQHFKSYTETSRSGKGLHIWVRGNIGKGVRRDNVEIYSQERYIICTGQVVLREPIRDGQVTLMNMKAQMQSVTHDKIDLVELEEIEPDEVIVERLMQHSNAAKFNDLCMGRYSQYGFPSQSEADLALMSMFCFYSESNEQCRRLFRMSALGKRDKAVKNDRYLNYTLKIIRTRQEQEKSIDLTAIQKSAELVVRIAQQTTGLHDNNGMSDKVTQPPTSVAATLAGPIPQAIANGTDGLDWPPGLMGHIASFIYGATARPVKEVSIVAALGLIAGICGKAWSIPRSGLNVYLILIARSGIGKEGMHDGVSLLCRAAMNRCPSIMDFVDFNQYASGPALIKTIASRPSLVNIHGEFGKKLKAMSQEGDHQSTSGYASLRTQMTDLYQKSGPQSIVGGITYSNKDNNIQSVAGVAFSMIGESTPGMIYDSLTETMMEDGFLSRFTLVEYTGKRVSLNTSPNIEPPKMLADAIGDLAQYAKQLIGTGQNVSVGRIAEASEIMHRFEIECDNEINSTDDESWRQMWNRASLKVMRISALCAVCDNWLHPVIDVPHVNWALQLIRNDINLMTVKLREGDIGSGDSARERKMLAVCADYLLSKPSRTYNISPEMIEESIITRSYLVVRLGRVSCFSNCRAGSRASIDLTIKSLISSGYLHELAAADTSKKYGFTGKAYRILNIPEDIITPKR